MEERKLANISPVEERIPLDVYKNLERVIWDEVNKCSNPEEFMSPYEFPLEKLEET